MLYNKKMNLKEVYAKPFGKIQKQSIRVGLKKVLKKIKNDAHNLQESPCPGVSFTISFKTEAC